MLKALVSEAELLDASNYTTESWDSFSSMLSSSKETVTKNADKDDTYIDENGSTEIVDAFNVLYEAINNLVEKDVNVTVNFNYYAGDIGEKRLVFTSMEIKYHPVLDLLIGQFGTVIKFIN